MSTIDPLPEERVPATLTPEPPPAGVPAPSSPSAAAARPAAGATIARHRRRRRFLFWGVLIVAAIALAFAWRYTHTAAPIQYVTAAVSRGDVVRGITASGSVNPETTVQVGTYVSGAIQAVYCDYNTRVTKGQLCARIDPRPYQTTVDQDRANLQAAQAQLEKDQTNLQLMQSTYQRSQELSQQQLLSEDQLDQAHANFEQAQAQVKVDQSAVTQRQAALQSAQVSLGYTNIVSPVDGTVVSRNVTVGQTVAASFQTPTLFLIATDLTRMQVDTSVSESDIGGVKTGAPASFSVEAFPDRHFDGSVTQVRQSPETVQNVVTYDVVVTVPNPDLLLKPGMTANVEIVTDERNNVLRVPDQALRYTPGGVASASGGPGTEGGRNGGAGGRGTTGGGGQSGASSRSGTAAAGNNAARGAGQGARGESVTSGGPAPARSTKSRVYVLREGAPVAVPVTTGLDDDTNTEILSGDLHEGDRVVVAEDTGSAGGSSTGRPPRLPRL